MDLESFIIKWNNRFPKDRLFRKKYGIAFGSIEHRQVNQIDVFLDVKEDELFLKYINQYKEKEDDLKRYKETGQFISKKVIEEYEEDLFSKIDVSQFNVPKQEVKKEDG